MQKHIMIGSLICVATVLIFLVFWGKLPNDVPIHFDSNGDVNSAASKGSCCIWNTCNLCNTKCLFRFYFDEKER